MYGKDLPDKNVVDIKLSSWKRKWIECDEKLRPKTIASSLKKCSKDMYPNFSVLLKLAAKTCLLHSTTPTNLVKSIHDQKESFIFGNH